MYSYKRVCKHIIWATSPLKNMGSPVTFQHIDWVVVRRSTWKNRGQILLCVQLKFRIWGCYFAIRVELLQMDTITLTKATASHPASELQEFRRPASSFMKWRTEKGKGSHVNQVSPNSQHNPQGQVFQEQPLLSTLSKQDGCIQSTSWCSAKQNWRASALWGLEDCTWTFALSLPTKIHSGHKSETGLPLMDIANPGTWDFFRLLFMRLWLQETSTLTDICSCEAVLKVKRFPDQNSN